jgi:hypothetical protein
MTVTVPEVKSVTVSKKSALRLFVGKFIVDVIETAAPSLAGVVLFVPGNTEDWKKLAIIVGIPLASAVLSAARRAWPAIKDWLTGE